MMKSRMMKCDRAVTVSITPIWTKQIWTKRIGRVASRVALGGALSLIALASVAPGIARAEDSDPGLFGSMLKSLGIGGENQIEYRERPPLVVPPTHELPPPQTSATVRDPNWPVDAGGNRQAVQKKGNQVRDLDKIAVPQRPVEPSVAASGAPPVGNSMGGPDTTATIPPSQPAASGGFFGNLFSSGGSNEKPATPIASAPARKSLTEPPPNYVSPSPNQPYGAPTPPVPKADATKAATTTPPGASGL
jgi:hypothetical protein